MLHGWDCSVTVSVVFLPVIMPSAYALHMLWVRMHITICQLTRAACMCGHGASSRPLSVVAIADQQPIASYALGADSCADLERLMFGRPPTTIVPEAPLSISNFPSPSRPHAWFNFIGILLVVDLSTTSIVLKIAVLVAALEEHCRLLECFSARHFGFGPSS